LLWKQSWLCDVDLWLKNESETKCSTSSIVDVQITPPTGRGSNTDEDGSYSLCTFTILQ